MSEQADMGDMSCDEFAEVAAELALGVLTGRVRAAALAHLDGCESCREQVRELTMTGEELLALLPSQEPPVGFESRVLDRIGLSAPSSAPSSTPSSTPSGHRLGVRRRAERRVDRGTDRPAGRPGARSPRARLRSALSAAAVVLALVGAGLGGWGLRAATAPAPSASGQSAINTAALVTAGHQTVGQAFIYNRSPWWMYMSVSLDGGGNVTVKCQLETADGQFKTVGTFRLDEGYGTWGSPYAIGGAVVGARLVAADGAVLATATFQ